MSGATLRWLASLVHRSPDGRAGRLTIIRHHRVYGHDTCALYRLGVRASVLRAQVVYLAEAGLTPVTVSDGLAHLASGAGGQRVAFTFDDGYADNVHVALPILNSAGAQATFFLTAGLMERREAPWWDTLAQALEHARTDRFTTSIAGQTVDLPLGGPAARAHALRALLPLMRVAPDEQRARLQAVRQAAGVSETAPCDLATWEEAARLRDAGMEIGAHTLTHPYLSLLDDGARRVEIEASMALIERRLGVRASGIAYPGGDHDAATVTASESAGLAWAVTTRAGDNDAATPRFELRRRALPEGACLGPSGRFSRHMTRAELDGAFDRFRAQRVAS